MALRGAAAKFEEPSLLALGPGVCGGLRRRVFSLIPGLPGALPLKGAHLFEGGVCRPSVRGCFVVLFLVGIPKEKIISRLRKKC